ncbi:MAG: hypothetical protein ACYS5V_08990 [Planctomycetota bacterium]
MPATTRPAAEAPYPPPKLIRACRAAAKTAMGQLDGSFRSVVRPPFVVIGNLPAQRLSRMADGSVVRPAEAMWRSYFSRKPTNVITIYLFRDAASYRRWARKLFNDKDLPYFGYYKPARRTLVMNIATGTGTLVHELTHALIPCDFPRVPTWFNEGLGSLHEQCYVRRDVIVGAVNWRLPALQKAIAAGKLRPLRELVSRNDFYGPRRGLNYAQARYFVMYMQHKGILKKFYHRFRRRPAAAAEVIESVFGQRMEKVEADYVKWVKGLKYPPR